MKKRISLAATWAVFVAAASLQVQAATFNVNDAFKANEIPGPAANPNGAYSYGYTSDPTGTGNFSTAGMVHTSAFNGNGGLAGYFIPNSAIVPAVLENVSGAPMAVNYGANLQKDELLLHPGGIGPDAFTDPIMSADLRYQVHTTGDYNISGLFEQAHSGTTDVHVFINGVSAFDSLSTSSLASRTFNFTQNITAGQYVDFVVGPSGDGIGGDSTGLFANINAVPEPATLAIWGCGALGFAFAASRRRKQAA